MKKNDVFIVDIIDVTYKGFGVAKVDGFPIFIENTLAGEKAEIKIVKVLSKFAYGIVINLLEESEFRVPLVDKVGTRIGTMPLQHMAYEEQLRFKKKLVMDVFSKLMDISDVDVYDTVGMENPWGYRNKAQVPVQKIHGQLESGFYKQGSHDLVPVTNFHIQDPQIDEAVVIIRDLLRKYDIPAYNEKKHNGIIRNITVKRGYVSGEVMVVLVVTQEDFKNKHQLLDSIWDSVEGIVSLVLNINDKKTNVIMGRQNITVKGDDTYSDELMGHTLHVSAASFYQVNPVQTEKLYQAAIDLASISKDDVVVDAYCGIGSISLSLAKQAKHVYGMDIVEDAIILANENADINGIDNVTFETGDAGTVIGEWLEQGIEIDVLVVDPPRKGLDETFINHAVSFSPKRIVYVSCNPATQARDVAELAKAGYKLINVQPVDMFPQTLHVESVALLVKNNN